MSKNAGEIPTDYLRMQAQQRDGFVSSFYRASEEDKFVAYALEKAYPELEKGDRLTLVRIRHLLGLTPKAKVEVKCFSESEVNLLKSVMTADELARVSFTWLEFKS